MESKTRVVVRVNMCLSSGDYARALEVLRGAAAEFPNDAELSELEKFAIDGAKRKAEADRLITASQDLFAQQKSAKAIQLLREAYGLDKNNGLPRAILANALVEHARSIVETDWWEAETLASEALTLNPAHPTARTIQSVILEQKEAGSVEEWVSQTSKLQASGNLTAALSQIAEGFAVHPHEPRLLQIQEAIKGDHGLQRRQARRRDLEDLHRMKSEIDAAGDVASRKTLSERIQAMANKHSTDGEILSIANALLLRLGQPGVRQRVSIAPIDSKSATPTDQRPGSRIAEASVAAKSQVLQKPVNPEVVGGEVLAKPTASVSVHAATVLPTKVQPSYLQPSDVQPSDVQPSEVQPSDVQPRIVSPVKVPKVAAGPPLPTPQPAEVPVERADRQHTDTTNKLTAQAIKVATSSASSSSTPPKTATSSRSTVLLFVSAAAAVVMVAAIFLFMRKQHATPAPKIPAAAVVSAPAASGPDASANAVPAPVDETPAPSPSASQTSDTAAIEVASDDQTPRQLPGHSMGTLVVIAGQDNATVFVNGKRQRQLTQSGQLRLPNLKLKAYAVQVSKSGFLDPSPQTIRIHEGDQARLVFNLQPQPRMASLTIQGGTSGTTVLVDQAVVGAIQPDGALSVSTIIPGEHTIELRKERFKPRQFKKSFVAGGAISLAAVDASLEAVPGALKITFAPADARVALVKGERLTMVGSGVPLELDPGTYTLTARTADSFTRSSTLEIVAGQSRTLDLSLAPNGMSKWDAPGAWKLEGDSFTRKGGGFALYGVAPATGTFAFSAMPVKGHLLQWVLNYVDSKNYILFQLDDNNFYRSVVRDGKKADEIIVPHIGETKGFRTLRILVSPTEIVHQIKPGNSWKVVDRWTQPGTNLSLGKFGFYLPGNDQIALTGFSQYVDLNVR